ncbi:MAG: hypothetical protein H0U44_09005 [Flavisolibacter sp.]|nr:hypothetical protein [Flavisolibacter sp.]
MAAILLTASFFSCKKEYSFEGGNFKNCISCTYLPVCDSSQYVYVDSTPTSVDTLHNTMYILGDSTINGKLFKKVSGFATFNTGLYANCDNQDYRLLFPLAALGLNLDSIVNDLLQQVPIPIPPGLISVPSTVETSVLKANLPTNSTWTDVIYQVNIPFLFSFSMGLEYTLLEKNVPRTVYQKTYNDVIHVKSVLKINSTQINIPLDFEIDYYFAKDVGIIEVHITEANAVTRVLKLHSYQL